MTSKGNMILTNIHKKMMLVIGSLDTIKVKLHDLGLAFQSHDMGLMASAYELQLNKNNFDEFTFESQYVFEFTPPDRDLFINYVKTSKKNIQISYSTKLDLIQLKVDNLVFKYAKNYDPKWWRVLGLELPSNIVINSDKLTQMINEMNNYDLTNITFENTEREFILSSPRQDQVIKIRYGMMSQVVTSYSGVAKTNFGTNYILDVSKHLKHISDVKIEWETDLPIRFIQKFGTNKIVYVVGPRNEPEEKKD